MRSLSAMLRSLFTATATKPIRQRARLDFLTLENRETPAIITDTAIAPPAPTPLTITATTNDVVQVGVDGSGHVTINGNPQAAGFGVPFPTAPPPFINASDISFITINCTAATGTPADNTIDLTAVNQTAFPNVGGILVNAGVGNDLVFGASLPNMTFGTATYNGGDGSDKLIGNSGGATFNAGAGDDAVFGGTGDNAINGGKGVDTLIGNQGDDTFTWNDGDGSDTIDGKGGHNFQIVNGGNGSDTFTLTSGGSALSFQRTSNTQFTLTMFSIQDFTLNGQSGDDTFNVSGLNKFFGLTDLDFNGNSGTNTLIGPNLATNYNIFGANGAGVFRVPTLANFVGAMGTVQNITGGTGNDVFRLNGGRVFGLLNAGGGTNTISFAGTTGVDVIVDLKNNTASQTGGISGFQNIIGSDDGNDTLTGTTGNNRIQDSNNINPNAIVTINGNGGADTIYGGAGVTTITPGSGASKVYAGSGNTKITASSATVLIALGEGFDQVSTTSTKTTVILSPVGTGIISGPAKQFFGYQGQKAKRT